MAIEAGRSPLCAMRPAQPGEWGVLKVSAVSWGEFQAEENKALRRSAQPDPRHEVRPGDVLISRANTPELVGRAVLVRTTRPRLLLSDKTLRLVPDPERISQEYLLLSLSTPSSRSQISAAASGSSRSMYNVSQDALRQVRISLPSLAEQQRITDLLGSLAETVQGAHDELSDAKALKFALAEGLLTGQVRVKPRAEAL